MASLDAAVSSEMVARRLTKSSPGLVFRLLTLYQPGGEQEKGLILYQLQSPAPASTAQGAVDALRAWGRWLRRSEAIGLTKPDPTILIRSLGMIVSLVLASEYHANFRTSLIRSALKVDTAPSYESVKSFYQHLLAEMEALATGTATSAASSPTSPSAPPRVKELRTGTRNGERNRNGESPTSMSTSLTPGNNQEKTEKRASTACRYFGKTNKGCTRGSKCPFKHGIEKRERCLECGGKGHQARECPTKVTRSQEARFLLQGILRPLR